MGENKKDNAELIEFTIFFAAMLFTCAVGIIELLPEFEKIKGIFGFTSVSALYFGLLIGIIFSMSEFFYLFKKNEEKIKTDFPFSRVEYFYQHAKIIKLLFYIIFLLIFIMLYFVKIGCLQ